MTLDDLRAAAKAVEKLGAIDDAARLRGAPLEEVLFWALNDGNVDVSGVPGTVVWGIRCDLDILASHVNHLHGQDFEYLADALFRLRRRLDVAHELITVLSYPTWAATQESWTRPNGAVLRELPLDPHR